MKIVISEKQQFRFLPAHLHNNVKRFSKSQSGAQNNKIILDSITVKYVTIHSIDTIRFTILSLQYEIDLDKDFF